MSEAIGMIETKGYTGNVEATDAMAKAANVTIQRTIQIGGVCLLKTVPAPNGPTASLFPM